ncbi:MAG: hypothetical protein A3J83_04540 [Elusimicrobia bacterium RIFOXYA2_FULL_40_6]|nr:MAG: hypothetical protein A3J83_04540 [Elusimicrobia bacterium RIFOXYA2_FULL_40_6]
MEMLTKKEIASGLKGLGVKKGGIILAHSSLKSFGKVDGGADAVIDALLESVGKTGTLCMPTNTVSLIGVNPPFHPLRSVSKVGIITEYFRFKKGVIRGVHPTHAVCALGPAANQIVSGHKPTDSPCGRKSAFKKLIDKDAVVLFLGCGLNPNTTNHVAEDWLGLPYITNRRGVAALVDLKNNVKKVSFPNEPGGHRDFYTPGSKINRILTESGKIKSVKIGGALVQMIKIRDIMSVVLSALKADPAVLLCDDTGCKFCSESKQLVLRDEEKILKRIDSLIKEF